MLIIKANQRKLPFKLLYNIKLSSANLSNTVDKISLDIEKKVQENEIRNSIRKCLYNLINIYTLEKKTQKIESNNTHDPKIKLDDNVDADNIMNKNEKENEFLNQDNKIAIEHIFPHVYLTESNKDFVFNFDNSIKDIAYPNYDLIVRKPIRSPQYMNLRLKQENLSLKEDNDSLILYKRNNDEFQKFEFMIEVNYSDSYQIFSDEYSNEYYLELRIFKKQDRGKLNGQYEYILVNILSEFKDFEIKNIYRKNWVEEEYSHYRGPNLDLIDEELLVNLKNFLLEIGYSIEFNDLLRDLVYVGSINKFLSWRYRMNNQIKDWLKSYEDEDKLEEKKWIIESNEEDGEGKIKITDINI